MKTKHTISQLDPTQYRYMGSVYYGNDTDVESDFAVFEAQDGSGLRVISKLTGETFPVDPEQQCMGRCAHCGAGFNYGAIMMHNPSDTCIIIGHICARNTFTLPSVAAVDLERLQRLAKAHRTGVKRAAFLEKFAVSNPGVWAVIEAAREAARSEDSCPGWGRDAAFVRDVFARIREKMRFSDKQLAAILSAGLRLWDGSAQGKVDARAAADAARTPCPEGRITVRGTILTTKWQEGLYGGALKMLVEANDGGWKVWGTCPDCLHGQANGDALKGSVVEFTAAVERSRDDQFFGFYKRPTKAVLVTKGGAE